MYKAVSRELVRHHTCPRLSDPSRFRYVMVLFTWIRRVKAFSNTSEKCRAR